MRGIASVTWAAAAQREYDLAPTIQLETGIFDDCRIVELRVACRYGPIEGPDCPPAILGRALELAAEF
jgi:hypothetical protein